MKIVNILGGLGNQMFQYAMAIALKHAFPEEDVKISTLTFRGYPLHNGFELDKLFSVRLPYANAFELSRVAYPWINYRLWQIGTKILPKRKGMTHTRDYRSEFSMADIADKRYFEGYWQSPKFFGNYRAEIKEAFTFPEVTDENNIRALDFVRSARTAFIHIRRGDYIDHPVLGGICTAKYYERALSVLTKDYGFRRFVISSNDIEWSREFLRQRLTEAELMFLDWNTGMNSFRDMQIMSSCKAGIIANSSFSWWGAWLGDMEVVLCPSRWYNLPKLNPETLKKINDDIIEKNWVKIEVD